MQKKLIVTLFLMLLAISEVYSQDYIHEMEIDTSEHYRVILIDGSELIGKILERTETLIVFSTNSIPRIEIPFEGIKEIKQVDELSIRSDGSYWFPNPNPTRYFVAPSAFSLKKGGGYYRNSYLVLNSINFGVTDNFSFGGGFEIISTFSGSPFVYVTPKVGFQISKNFHLSTGLFLATVENYIGGAVYGIGTYGNTDDNISAGLSMGFAEGELLSRPLFILGGMKRVSSRVSLISENFFFPEYEDIYNLHLYGIRFFGTKISADLGFINNADIVEWITIGFPYVGFAVKF